MGLLEEYEKEQLKKSVTPFNVGDTVDVHVRIVEGEKERVQVFSGTVIARKGSTHRETFTVRRIVAGEGVERIFPLHSPWIQNIKVRRTGKVRRAKLYYLRQRVGKATKVKELMSYEKKGKKTQRRPSAAKKPLQDSTEGRE